MLGSGCSGDFVSQDQVSGDLGVHGPVIDRMQQFIARVLRHSMLPHAKCDLQMIDHRVGREIGEMCKIAVLYDLYICTGGTSPHVAILGSVHTELLAISLAMPKNGN